MARITKNRNAMFFDTDFPVAEPSSDNLYTNDSYTGGALVLNALRMKIGDDDFFKLLQTFAERYRYGNAGTDEFIALAQEVSGEDLKDFFDQWLFSKRIPDLPEQ
jgi:aminopeptidase N